MADDKRGPSGPPGGKRRRPTTIDLKATEIASESVTPPEPADSPPAPPPTEAQSPAPEAQSEPSTPEMQEPPRSGGWRDRLDLLRFKARMAERRGSFSRGMNWRPIAAGVTGAAAMVIVFLALWGSGAFNARDDVTGILLPRVAALDSQVRDLANRPQPPSVEPRTITDLTARVATAEQAMGRLGDLDARIAKLEAGATTPRTTEPDQNVIARVTALEGAARDAKSRADAAFEAAQKTAAPPAVAPADFQALSSRVAALEQAAKSAEEKIARTAGADRIGRLAFVAVALRGVVERGEPFEKELAAVKPLVPDANALAPLEPFAATGLPRSAALAHELSQLSGPMLSAAGAAPREGGVLDRLQQNAERLVRIRPISEAPGDDPATVITRAELKATQGDLPGAVSEISHLPPAARAPAQAWIKRAQAQTAALAAVRKLADDAIGGLGKASQ
jgi:hypothetical protein